MNEVFFKRMRREKDKRDCEKKREKLIKEYRRWS